jgi:hypothetical protein
MINSNVDARVVEIQKLVASNELNSAVKRLMDFVYDFNVSKKRLHEVILISRAHNELNEDIRLYGTTEKNISRATKLSSQILEFTDTILDEKSACEITLDTRTSTTNKTSDLVHGLSK